MYKSPQNVAHPLRRLALRSLIKLRQSSLRQPILKTLVKLHNVTYHQISFFSSHTGQHPKHQIINYQKFFLDNVNPQDTVLDIGTGDGHVAFALTKKAKQVIGIDNDADHIASAQNAYSAPNLSFIFGDATTYQFKQTFDTIILSNVLEHIENRLDFLTTIAQLGAKILIRVPLITRDWLTVYKKQAGLEYRLDATHYIEYDPISFQKEMEAAHLSIDHFHINFGEIYAVVSPVNQAVQNVPTSEKARIS